MNKFLFFSILLLVGFVMNKRQSNKRNKLKIARCKFQVMDMQVLDGNVLIVEWNLMFLIHS